MSNRHRTSEVVLPHHEERRVQARSERHRVNTALADVTGQIHGGLEPDDVIEPGVASLRAAPRPRTDPSFDPPAASLEAQDVEAAHGNPPSQGSYREIHRLSR